MTLRNFILTTLVVSSTGFLSSSYHVTSTKKQAPAFISTGSTSTSSKVNLFDKMFEDEGMLGKGITVGKVQVAVISSDRSSTSIIGMLEGHAAKTTGDDPAELAKLANEVCLTLMRKSDDWIGACSSSKWFSEKDSGKAESYYNEIANAEAVKFEKEYIPTKKKDDGDDDGIDITFSTMMVVSLVLEIQGDSTKFDGAGYSISQTKEILASIASDCVIGDGCCVNAVEVFWVPGDKEEVLTKQDLILDFPELIDL